MSDTPDITRTIEEILNEFGGRIMGRWEPRPGEEGFVYPTRLKDEAVHKLVTLFQSRKGDL